MTRMVIINNVKGKMDDDPNTSIRQLGREFSVPEKTMRRVVKENLRLKSLAVVRMQQLTPQQRRKGLSMCKRMLNMVKGPAAGKICVFSDEKDFHLSKHVNRRNDRVIGACAKAVTPKNTFAGRPKFPKKAMFFGFIGTNGKAFPGVWIQGSMDGAMNKQILARRVFPILDRIYSVGNYIWMQDGASCHTCISVLAYLEHRLKSNGFW